MIKKILVSQPKPTSEKSPYFEIASKYGVEVVFRPFIKIEGLSAKEFRQQKVSILDYTAVVFTSRNAIDHFFLLCKELRVTIPEDMKYFCITETIALYIQKYVQYRKRKVFFGSTGKVDDLLPSMVKHKTEKYLVPLSDAIIEHIPAPKQLEGTPQMLITSLDYSAYTGRIAVGRVHRGTLKEGMNITLAKRDGSLIKSKIKELHTFEGLGRKKTDAVSSGDICAVVGVEGFEIGDTICDFENPEPLPPIAIDEPTMSMLFTINDSPFFGKEGKFVTSRHIQDRLTKELDKNLALRVRKSELEDGKWIVSGRGVLHLSVLIETMRREGYELQVGQPQVIFKEIDGVKCEPIEELTISVPEEYSSKMIDMVTRRKGDLVSMETQGDRVNIEFDMPSRGIIGLRTNVLTASAGEAIMAHRFKCYQPYKGEIERRSNGSMIAMESGTAFAYAIDKLQDRGKFFIYPQDEVYAGQVVGEHVHENDLVINVTKSKKLTNMRASGSDDKARIIPPVVFSLEEALEYIKEDEYVEVTPKSMRMRKVILDETERKRANKS